MDPSGRVDHQHVACFENLEEWKKYAREEWQEQRAMEPKREQTRPSPQDIENVGLTAETPSAGL